MKAPLRTKSIGTKVSEEEFAALEECARQADMTLSEWVRAVLLAAPGVELPDDEAALAGRVTLAEVLALRTLFLNLQFRQAQGPMTEAEMRGLIERADAVKGERARERMEAARRQARKRPESRLRSRRLENHRQRRVEQWRNGAGSSTRNRGRAGRTCGRGELFSLAACSSCS